jgi:hypothetical protein
MIYSDGDYIIRQGEIGEMFYVLFSGQVNCTKTLEDGSEIDLIQLDAGQIFGERALIKQEPRGANVIAMGETECLTMSKVDFKIMLQDVVDQMNQINEFRILRAAPMFRLLTDTQVVFLLSQPQHASGSCRATCRMISSHIPAHPSPRHTTSHRHPHTTPDNHPTTTPLHSCKSSWRDVSAKCSSRTRKFCAIPNCCSSW